jgi:DNA polymerase-3 subunit alpha
MYFKVHYPEEFYAASAKCYGDAKQRDGLRDAEKHGIRVLKPRVNRSSGSWKPAGKGKIRAGFSQIKGIGGKMSANITAYLDDLDSAKELATWDDLQQIKGVGPKTIESIKAWVAQPDPFDIHRLENNIRSIKKELAAGKLRDETGPLPFPTHSSRELDEEQPGRSVVWLGEMVKYNIRDINEINVARGNTADLDNIKDPHLREFCIIYARDEDDQTMLKVNRWRFPRYKNDIFALKGSRNLVLVKGRKPRYGVQVDRLWVIAPDEEE